MTPAPAARERNSRSAACGRSNGTPRAKRPRVPLGERGTRPEAPSPARDSRKGKDPPAPDLFSPQKGDNGPSDHPRTLSPEVWLSFSHASAGLALLNHAIAPLL